MIITFFAVKEFKLKILFIKWFKIVGCIVFGGEINPIFDKINLICKQ